MNNYKVNVCVKTIQWTYIEWPCRSQEQGVASLPEPHPQVPLPGQQLSFSPRENYSPDSENNNALTFLYSFTSYIYVPKCSFDVAVFKSYVTRIILCVFVCVCLVSVAQQLFLWKSPMLMCKVVHSFLFLCNVPFYEYTTIYFFIFYMGCLGLLWTMLLWIFLYIYPRVYKLEFCVYS